MDSRDKPELRESLEREEVLVLRDGTALREPRELPDSLVRLELVDSPGRWASAEVRDPWVILDKPDLKGSPDPLALLALRAPSVPPVSQDPRAPQGPKELRAPWGKLEAPDPLDL